MNEMAKTLISLKNKKKCHSHVVCLFRLGSAKIKNTYILLIFFYRFRAKQIANSILLPSDTLVICV